ncbi:TonB-dependent receptor [Opitutus sp. ER46]|uniref:TonB-dependent receptor plug domain-containing protein n=1 Tax=Opitutus sp. ER46 TaxID=2161864 RepID=UPI0011B1DD7D|nr:TonB-dependent receptor [Opitutus sp. ER46]
MAAAALALGGASAFATASSDELAELSLEQLMSVKIASVSGASKFEQKVTRAPSSVTIVTADEIANFGHRTLGEVLASVRGLYVSNDSNYIYLGIRGFLRPGDYDSRKLVLIDGHRMNENIFDSTELSQGTLDVGLIDRVEIIRGPSSSVYGSSAFNGVLNIVTRRGRQLDGGEISTEFGSFGATKARVSYGKLFKNELELLISATRYQSDGRGAIYYPEFDQRISDNPRARNDGVAQNADSEDAKKLFGSIKYRDLTVTAYYAARDKQVPTASFDTLFNDPRETTYDARGYVDVRYDREVTPQLHLQGRAAYDSYAYRGDYPFPSEPGAASPTYVNHDDTLGEWLSLEGQATATLAGKHTFLAGAEVRQNLHQNQYSYDLVEPRIYNVADERDSRIFGAYAQGEIALHRDVLLNAGLRYDHYTDSFGGTFNPRVALIYDPVAGTTIKALYGTAYRAPNPYERFYYPPPAPIELRPEKIHSYELALDQYFAGDSRASVSVYRYSVHDLISQVPLPAGDFYFDNMRLYSATGVELEFEGRSAHGTHLRTSYAFERGRDHVNDREMSNSPRHLAKLNLAQPLLHDRLTAGLELQYMGSVRTYTGTATDDFLLTNLTFRLLHLPGGLELSASIYNLFDTAYGYVGAEEHAQRTIPQKGRNFRLKATLRF